MTFVFKKKRLAFTILAVTIMVLACPIMSKATEPDSYTYSCIKLEDSSAKINDKLNQILREVVSEINQSLAKNSKSSIKELFSYHYFKKMFVDDYGQDAFSVFEMCIDTNRCEGWPYFERIALYPKESVYFESNYSRLTKKYLASNIEACGVRFSTDKLTHMLKDGFRYFYGKNKFGLSDEDVLRISKFSETSIMGVKSTGVYSAADIVANVQGVHFFENLMNKHFVKQPNKSLQFKSVNICEFIDSNFDERVLKNVYPEKSNELKIAIQKRINQCSEQNREVVLARTHEALSITGTEKAIVTFKNISEIINPDAKMLKRIMDNFYPSVKEDRYPIY